MLLIALIMVSVVVAPLLVFPALMILLALAAGTEHTFLRRIHFDPEARPFWLTVEAAFDSQHAQLWSTQLPGLRCLAAAGPRGMSYHDLFTLAYQSAAQHYPELYEGTSFAQWLWSLEQAGLITLRANRAVLTPLGHNFLRYCPTEFLAVA